MIVASCPLRISLVGGSTDHPRFLEKYKKGSVISFPSNLRTYITIHQDVFGSNAIDHKYNISYSKRETVNSINDIQNELVRYCFDYLQVEQINCTLHSDIHSVGSGLAASSSYLQALIKAVYVMREQLVNEFEVCKIAQEIEKSFNPLVGQQDFFGSMAGFKRINFYYKNDPEIKYLSTKILNSLDLYLLPTGINRNSTAILETLDVSKSLPLLKDVDQLELAIMKNDVEQFNYVIKRSWHNKKATSTLICNNPILQQIDRLLDNDKRIMSHKLCGAGNGGYFLLFTEKDVRLSYDYPTINKIKISETGLKYVNLKNEFGKI